MQLTATVVTHSVVCVLGTQMSCVQMAEPIEIPLGGWLTWSE